MDLPSPSSWSDLPKDLLLSIADLLDSSVHRLRLRAVCRSWCSVVSRPCWSPPLRLPFPMGPSGSMNPKRSGYFNLVHSTVYCLQPLKKPTDTSIMTTESCWLIRIEETEEYGKVRLKHPLFLHVDSQTLSSRLPKRLNLLDYRVYDITKVYGLQFVDDGNITDEIDYPEFFYVTPTKVAVYSDKGSPSAVMAIHGASQLSIWKKGEDEWTSIVDPRCAVFTDVVYHNGKFYALDADGVTISVNLSSSEERALVRQIDRPSSEKRSVSYHGDLFFLDVHVDIGAGPLQISRFHVHKLMNEDEGEWVGLRTLGKRAIFVSDGCSFCVSDEECCGCKKNCIYYTDIIRAILGIDPDENVALFDMEDYSCEFLSRDSGSFGLFWPPASWVFDLA